MLKRFCAVLAACAFAACALMLAGCSTGGSYQPSLKDAVVSSPVIGEDGTLRVGVNTDKSPLAGMSSANDQIIGMDVDIAAAIADELGLKLSIVDVGSDPHSALEEGTVDIVMGIDSSDSSADFWTSDEYLETGVGLFASASGDTSIPDRASSPVISAQISSTSAWAVSNAFGEDALDACVKITDAFGKLSTGSADYVASDVLVGLYSAHRESADVQLIAMLSAPGGYCVGVSSDNTELQNLVAQAVESLVSGGAIDVVEMKWLGTSIDLSSVERIASSAPASDTDEETTEDDGSDSAAGTDEAADDAGNGDVSSEDEALAAA